MQQEKIIETRTCSHCSRLFNITDIDTDFLTRLTPTIAGRKFDLPFPTLCPTCRKIRRYAWRNEKNIYKRKCDATGKDIISLYSPDAPCPVYEREYWYSDKWDAHMYAKDFDFSRTFFEVWGELKKQVPIPGRSTSKNMENSDYSDLCGDLKNCYLCFNANISEDCLYMTDIHKCRKSIDGLSLVNCENCYELLDARDCYAVHFSYDVNNCRDSYFLRDCYGCSDSYGCFGLKNQKYHIYNTSYNEDEYKQKLSEIFSETLEVQKDTYERFLKDKGYDACLPKVFRSENVRDSSRVFDSKDISFSTRINDSEKVRYTAGIYDTRTAMDYEIWGDRADRIYESHQVGEMSSNILFSISCWSNVSNLLYCNFCIDNVHNCFGCIGLRNAEYCILNKQYTKEEYENLVPKIIGKMYQDNEWGELFPASFSHFGYNETMNMIVFPLSKEQALEKGFAWSNYEAPFPKAERIIPGVRLPENIDDIPDDILNWAIECEVSGKPFRIVKPELEFYRKHHVPMPRRHPDERYKDRAKIYINY